jgi:hypothetical protein
MESLSNVLTQQDKLATVALKEEMTDDAKANVRKHAFEYNFCYEQAGKLKEAASFMKVVLNKRKRNLGEEHIYTILAMRNLAHIYSDQGMLEKAALMRKRWKR